MKHLAPWEDFSWRIWWSMVGVWLFTVAVSVFMLTGCATVPEQKIVASVATLPPQKIAVSVLCVKASDIPPMPATTFDPKAAYTEQLAAQAQADIDNLKIYAGQLNAIAVGCASGKEVEK